MDDRDEARLLRHRQKAAADALDRISTEQAQGMARYLGRVYSGGAIPTAMPRVFLTHPLSVSVAESEGAAPTVTPDTSVSVPVVVVGPTAPVVGDDVLARLIDGVWIGQVAGPTRPYMTCTPCSIPKQDLYCRFYYTGNDFTLSHVDFTLVWDVGLNLWVKYYSANTFPNDYQVRYGAVNPTHRFELVCGDVSAGPAFAIKTGALVRHWFYNGGPPFNDPGPPTTPTKFNSNMSWARMFSTATRSCSPFGWDTSTFDLILSTMGVNDQRIIVSEDPIPP